MSDEKKTFEDVRLDVRHLGTAIHNLGLSEKKAAIIGTAGYGWIISYFALMASGSVTVPADKEMPAEELAAIINKAGCEAVFYSAEIADKVAVFKSSCPTVKNFVSFSVNGDKAEGDSTVWELIEAGAANFTDGNNIYYDTLGIARQNSKPMSVMSASLRKDFQVGKMHFENRALFQLSLILSDPQSSCIYC